MADYLDEVRDTFRTVESDDLAARVKAGTLTDEAHAAAIAELASRGASTADLPTTPSPSEPALQPGFFRRCFTGNERLWKVYWLLGFGLAILLRLQRAIGAAAVEASLLIFLLIILPYIVFWSISVWRCAYRSSHWIWAILARASVVVLGLTLIVSFVQGYLRAG